MADLSKAPRFGKNWQSLGDVWSVVAASIFFRGIRMLPVIAVIAVFPDFSKIFRNIAIVCIVIF